jgi:hypothetical protein
MIRIEVAVAGMAMVGETASADRHVVKVEGSHVLVAVVDGLGHGESAAQAALSAVQAVEEAKSSVLVGLVTQLHERLRGTRGVVMSIAAIDLAAGNMQWLGVGNVAGVLVRGLAHERPNHRASLVQSAGVIGHSLPPLRAEALPVATGDTLVFATDGVDTAFERYLSSGLSLQALAQRLLSQYGRSSDDALVLVARLVGGRP